MMALAVPWAGWVTIQLVQISVHVSDYKHVEVALRAHVADSHTHGIGTRIEMLSRMERNEERIAELRGFHRGQAYMQREERIEQRNAR
jgi:hypothetical protein